MNGLLSALVLVASGALAPRFDVTVAPRELNVGDRAEVVLSLKLGEEIPSGGVTWPELNALPGGAEVLEIGPVETATLDNGDRILTRRLGVTFFEVGNAVIPSMALEVSTASGPLMLASDAIDVAVISVLPEGDAELEAKPPAPPRSLEMGEPFWWASGALLATCLAALVLLARQASGRGDDAGLEPKLSPRQELALSLESLRSEDDAAALHEGVSMTTRRYIGRLLAFPAPESTTSEVDRELRRRQLDPDLARRTRHLLSTCDMVMFARREVSLESGRERINEIEAIADGLDAWIAPALEDESTGDGRTTEESPT